MIKDMMRRSAVIALALALILSMTVVLGEGIPEMEAPEDVVMLRSARIRAVGDLMVHAKQLRVARQRDGSYDFYPQYELIRDSLSDADYTIANMETTIGKYKNRDYSGYPMFNSPESLLDAVKDAGVDFLTLANNHMLDRYFEGLISTIDAVEARGFAHGGSNRTPEEKESPVIVEVNGIKIGMLCYTQMTNGVERYCPSAVREYGVNYLKNANFEREVRALREAGADLVFAMPHWDAEYNLKPAASTVALARKMIAAGVDVILGSHSHVVQPVEFVSVELPDGGTRTGLVAYSLGNFISNMVHSRTDYGIILEFTVREKPEGGFEIADVGAVPVFCWRRDNMIQAVPALKCIDERPQGMNSTRYSQMKASVKALKQVLGEGIPLIRE